MPQQPYASYSHSSNHYIALPYITTTLRAQLHQVRSTLQCKCDLGCCGAEAILNSSSLRGVQITSHLTHQKYSGLPPQ
jgi:hypothetical protein